MRRPTRGRPGPIDGWLALLLTATCLGADPNLASAQAPAGNTPNTGATAGANGSAFHAGVLLMPYVGANLALGDTSKAFNLGYRVGGLVGWRVSPALSLNGEITFDHLGPIDEENGYVLHASAADFAFSPSFHIALDRGAIVIGPKLGVYRFATVLSIDWLDLTPKEDTNYDLVYGLNLGVLGRAGGVGVGVLMGYTARHAAERCPTRDMETVECPHGLSEQKLFSVAVAFLY